MLSRWPPILQNIGTYFYLAILNKKSKQQTVVIISTMNSERESNTYNTYVHSFMSSSFIPHTCTKYMQWVVHIIEYHWKIMPLSISLQARWSFLIQGQSLYFCIWVHFYEKMVQIITLSSMVWTMHCKLSWTISTAGKFFFKALSVALPTAAFLNLPFLQTSQLYHYVFYFLPVTCWDFTKEFKVMYSKLPQLSPLLLKNVW